MHLIRNKKILKNNTNHSEKFPCRDLQSCNLDQNTQTYIKCLSMVHELDDKFDDMKGCINDIDDDTKLDHNKRS